MKTWYVNKQLLHQKGFLQFQLPSQSTDLNNQGYIICHPNMSGKISPGALASGAFSHFSIQWPPVHNDVQIPSASGRWTDLLLPAISLRSTSKSLGTAFLHGACYENSVEIRPVLRFTLIVWFNKAPLVYTSYVFTFNSTESGTGLRVEQTHVRPSWTEVLKLCQFTLCAAAHCIEMYHNSQSEEFNFSFPR